MATTCPRMEEVIDRLMTRLLQKTQCKNMIRYTYYNITILFDAFREIAVVPRKVAGAVGSLPYKLLGWQVTYLLLFNN